jgi:hypothetical protein
LGKLHQSERKESQAKRGSARGEHGNTVRPGLVVWLDPRFYQKRLVIRNHAIESGEQWTGEGGYIVGGVG